MRGAIGTTSYTLLIKFKSKDSPEPLEETFVKHVVIGVKRDPDPVVEFFVSHKDPEDTLMAKTFEHYLHKIGFRAFVAEEDRRPGVQLWDEKIYPAINRCKALIVLWTENSKNLIYVMREIEHANQKNKPVILMIMKGMIPPEIIHGGIEHHPIEQFTDKEIIKAVAAINKAYESGDYESNQI